MQNKVVNAKKDNEKAEATAKAFLSGVVSLLKMQSERLVKLRDVLDEDVVSTVSFERIDTLIGDYTKKKRTMIRALKANFKHSNFLTKNIMAIKNAKAGDKLNFSKLDKATKN